jgi:FAD:protein FMN transferase
VEAPGIYTSSFMAMGTRCDVVLIHDDTDFAERVCLALQKETTHLEHLLSRFQPGSPVTRFNAMLPGELFSPGETLWSFILQCRRFCEITFGAFDITAGPLIKLLKDNPGSALIDQHVREKAGSLTGFGKLHFDEENKTIQKLTEGVELDFGSVGKGLALDNMKKVLSQYKISTAFISFGESSLMALGKHPAGDYWPVGIPNPFNQSEILHTFKVIDGFITTSGTILNSDRAAGDRRIHIVDPRNGMAVVSESMVSVKSASAVWGEVLSTSWLILSDAEREMLAKQPEETEVFMVTFNEGKIENNLLTVI